MDRQEAQRAFERCGTLADVLKVRSGWEVVEVIVQDEYTHDVVLQAVAGGPAIVLDCT